MAQQSKNLAPIYLLVFVLGLVIGAGVGIFGYIYFVGGSGEASRDISEVAPTLDTSATASNDALATAQAQIDALSTQVAELSAPVATEDAASPAATEEVTAEATAEVTAEAAAAELAVFRIVPEQSEVRFTLEEDLRGVRTVVVGVTNQVAGEIGIDLANPVNSRVGAIRINMRTLTTDNDFRNRAIRSEILQTARDEFEFSDFIPTALENLPASIAVGETVTFQITGNFTIAGIERPLTFETSVTLVSENEIRGTATTTVLRSDYNLQIPNVPGVTNVTDEVELAIDFVAQRAS